MRFTKLLIFYILISLVPFNCYSQIWNEVRNNRDKYFVGEGTGATLEEADKVALSALISQISINVVYQGEITDSTLQSKGKIVSDNTLFQSTIKTVSAAQLANTVQLVLQEKPEYKVARWIKRSELDRLFESRRKKTYSLIEAASQAEEKGKIDVALRQYYWAYTLVRSMQHSNEESYEGHTLMSWLPSQIETILQDLDVVAVKKEGEDVQLKFQYKNKPVSSVDYTYSDGGLWSSLCSVKNGLGSLEITSTMNLPTYDIEIEVEYRDQADLDPEIQNVMAYAPEYKFKNAYIKIPSNIKTPIKPESNDTDYSQYIGSLNNQKFATDIINQTFTSIPIEDIVTPPTIEETKAAKYTQSLYNIEKSIKEKTIPSEEYFTPTALGLYRRLIKYGNGKIIGTPKYSFATNGDYSWARGLTMNFSFRNGKRKNFTEDVVFTFDKNDKICNIAFGLGVTTTADILTDNAVPEQARMLLADFMENYQTAFAMKRLDYIKSIFSEDALIIVVNNLNNTSSIQSKEYPFKNILNARPDHEVIKLNRDGYIDRLERNFASKEYINLRFNSTQLSRSYSNPNIYGIQIEQDYYSSNYCDHGYLFLQINLTNPEQPLIQIRTWQSEPDPKFGLYNLDDFPIQRFD